MRAPDGSYEDGFIAPGDEKLPAPTVQPGNLERNNPLSLHDEVCESHLIAQIKTLREFLLC
jgi:hypothetical protein